MRQADLVANMLEARTNVGLGACLFTKFFKLDCLKHHFLHSQDRNWLNSIFDFKKKAKSADLFTVQKMIISWESTGLPYKLNSWP